MGVRNAISLAAVQAAGVHEVSESAQASKPLSPAKAAYGGVLSGRMARLGHRRASRSPGGKQGIPQGLHRQVRFRGSAEGTRAEVRHHHVLFEVVSRLPPLPRRYRRRRFVCTKPVMRGWRRSTRSRFTSTRTPSRSSAASSNPIRRTVPNSVCPTASPPGCATAATRLDSLDVARSFDSGIRELVRKIEIVSDPALENRAANLRGARVQLLFKDGTSKEAAVTLAQGRSGGSGHATRTLRTNCGAAPKDSCRRIARRR